MNTLLIPTDFSDNSWNALEFSIKLFQNQKCNIYLMHVGKLSQSPVRGNAFSFPKRPLEKSLKQKFTDFFGRIEQLPHNELHRFIALQEYGSLINCVRKIVPDKKIDLIVMGTKGASGIREKVMGSNTGDVITKVRCNVLVVPENVKKDFVDQIIFPTDYQIFYTHDILQKISELMSLTNANLSVLHVSKIKKHLNDVEEQHQGFLFEYLTETFPDKTSFHTLFHEDVNKGIERFMSSIKADLIVMVAKNLNFLQQLFFDSTIEKLSFHTQIPLLVLHE